MHLSSALAAGLSLFSVAASSPLQPRATPSPASTHSSEFQTLGCPNTTSPIATEYEQFVAANTFAQTLFVQKKVSQAFSTYVASDLINHAPDVPGDGAALAQSVVSGLISASQIEIQRVVVGQDIATTFFKAITPMGTAAAMEMFRMSGTCLVEHWVIQQAVQGNSSNPHAWF